MKFTLQIGPGQLTRSMALAGAKKVVALEPVEAFKESLKVRTAVDVQTPSSAFV